MDNLSDNKNEERVLIAIDMAALVAQGLLTAIERDGEICFIPCTSAPDEHVPTLSAEEVFGRLMIWATGVS